jgi:hypothetical protein
LPFFGVFKGKMARPKAEDLSGDDGLHPVGTTAKFLAMSESYLLQMTARGIIPQARDSVGKTVQGRWSLIPALHGYLRFLEKEALKSGGSEWRAERTGLIKSQRKKAELEAERMEQSLIKVEDAIVVMKLMFANIRAKSLAAVGPLSEKVGVERSKVAEVMQILKEAIAELLVGLRTLRTMHFVRIVKGPISGNGQSMKGKKE